MLITVDLLREHDACADGIDWFEKNYPAGCELTDASISTAKDVPTDFVWWFYNNVKQDKLLYKLCGVNGSDGVNRSFGILNSFGVNNALFLANKPKEHFIFGKKVTEERFKGVRLELYQMLAGWRPTFNNIRTLYLKHGSDWKDTPIRDAEELQIKEAWADMPATAIDYVAGLLEFDHDMFVEITGIEM